MISEYAPVERCYKCKHGLDRAELVKSVMKLRLSRRFPGGYGHLLHLLPPPVFFLLIFVFFLGGGSAKVVLLGFFYVIPYPKYPQGLMDYRTTKFENDANRPSCFQQLYVCSAIVQYPLPPPLNTPLALQPRYITKKLSPFATINTNIKS